MGIALEGTSNKKDTGHVIKKMPLIHRHPSSSQECQLVYRGDCETQQTHKVKKVGGSVWKSDSEANRIGMAYVHKDVSTGKRYLFTCRLYTSPDSSN